MTDDHDFDRGDQTRSDAHRGDQTRSDAQETDVAPVDPSCSGGDQGAHSASVTPAAPILGRGDHAPSAAQTTSVVPAESDLDGGDHSLRDAQKRSVTPVDPPPTRGDHMSTDAQDRHVAPGGDRAHADALLLFYAELLDDLEKARIAAGNRAKALVRNLGDNANHPDIAKAVETAKVIAGDLAAVEHQAELALCQTLRHHSLGPWVAATKGVGEKQGARLIAAIGDPAWNSAAGRPRRGPGELWAYCGYAPIDGRARHHERGRKSNWNTDAHVRAYLCADKAVRAGVRKLKGFDDTDGYDVDHRKAISPLGQVYLDGRRKYADAIHTQECVRCGPSGKPAQPGSPLSDGHKHGRALTLVAKEILKGLWRAAS